MNLLNIGDSPKKMQKEINADLKILNNWLLANKISLNCDKTEIIFFHKPGDKTPDLKIKMNGHRIIPSSNIKYLGMYLDETLNGAFHCKILSQKLKRANGMLCKARHYVSADDLKTLYFAIFSSHLTYACQIWGQTENVHNKKVVKLQNRALRIITFSNFTANSDPLFAKLKILKFKYQVIFQNCLFVYDTLTNVSPVDFNNYFKQTRNMHSLQTRSINLGSLLVTKSSTVKYGLYSITKKCIGHWNFMTKEFNSDLLTLSRFKLKCKLKAYFTQ